MGKFEDVASQIERIVIALDRHKDELRRDIALLDDLHGRLPALHHHHDGRPQCGRDAPDLTSMAYLAASADDWLVVTGNGRIGRNRAERLAFRQGALKGFVLAPAFQKIPMHQRASILLWRWPDIDQITNLTAAPFLFELPAHRSSRLRPMSL